MKKLRAGEGPSCQLVDESRHEIGAKRSLISTLAKVVAQLDQPHNLGEVILGVARLFHSVKCVVFLFSNLLLHKVLDLDIWISYMIYIVIHDIVWGLIDETLSWGWILAAGRVISLIGKTCTLDFFHQ